MQEIINRLKKFRDDRKWQKHHTLPELSRALSVEAGELNRLYLWNCELQGLPTMEQQTDEIADCLIYALNMCLVLGVNPLEIINKKIDKNEIKYPVVSA